MDKEVFKKLIKDNKRQDKIVDNLYKLGVNIIDSELCSIYGTVFDTLMKLEYGEEGADWVSYFLYELPGIIEYNKEHGITEPYATEKDGTPIGIDTVDQLYDYLEKNYSKGKKQ